MIPCADILMAKAQEGYKRLFFKRMQQLMDGELVYESSKLSGKTIEIIYKVCPRIINVNVELKL